MRIDAAHRSTLVQCYLALVKDGKLTDADRPLILPRKITIGPVQLYYARTRILRA